MSMSLTPFPSNPTPVKDITAHLPELLERAPHTASTLSMPWFNGPFIRRGTRCSTRSDPDSWSSVRQRQARHRRCCCGGGPGHGKRRQGM